MVKQRHQIKRQILEIKIPQTSQSQSFYSEINRIHHRQILPFLDKWCTELSTPDHIHRIESLELNLGSLNIHNLEEEMMSKLGKVLPDALAARIRIEEHRSSQQNKKIRQMSQLELFTLFVRTGTLPWWVDISQPHLLNNVLESLIQKSPDSLVSLMEKITREKKSLRRIVLSFGDKMLSSLCLVLTPALEISLPLLTKELIRLLQKGRILAETKEEEIRNLLWLGILTTASMKGRQVKEPLAFWKEVFLQTALQSHITYATMINGLKAALQSEAAYTDLGSSIQKETVAVHSQFREIIETVVMELTEKTQETDDIFRILRQFQHSSGPLSLICKTLYPVAKQFPEMVQAQLISVLKSSGSGVAERERVKEIIQLLNRAVRQHLLSEILFKKWRHEVQNLQADGMSADALSELTEILRDSFQDTLISQTQEDETSIDLRFSDADELYINNSGLVILWPFLSNFFNHLGLIEEKQFKDRVSVHRAVGLLQYLVTEDPFPAEYLLPLNKVLCAMELSDVFDFQMPVNATEAQECSNLLTAVIEHAPILKNMSLPGFRGSFLIRKGVLSTRDGAWLLRVEKESYDIVLERFPWSFEWIKLPWMEVPLRVEW